MQAEASDLHVFGILDVLTDGGIEPAVANTGAAALLRRSTLCYTVMRDDSAWRKAFVPVSSVHYHPVSCQQVFIPTGAATGAVASSREADAADLGTAAAAAGADDRRQGIASIGQTLESDGSVTKRPSRSIGASEGGTRRRLSLYDRLSSAGQSAPHFGVLAPPSGNETPLHSPGRIARCGNGNF